MATEGITLKDGVLTVATKGLEKFTMKEVRELRCRPNEIRRIDMSQAEGLKEISKAAFGKSEMLEEVILPEGLEVIEFMAFALCYNLTKVVFPSTLKTIGQSAFESCRSLKEIVLPAGLETIDKGAFSKCKGLTNVVIPSESTYVHPWAFLNAGWKPGVGAYEQKAAPSATQAQPSPPPAAESVKIEVRIRPSAQPAPVPQQKPIHQELYHVSDEGVMTFPDDTMAFPPFVKIKPEHRQATRVVDLSNLKKLTSLTTLKLSLMAPNATKLVLPPSITEIGDEEFMNNDTLVEVVIPEGVTRLGEQSFWMCNKLRKVHLPSTLIEIGPSAFAYCDRLEEIKFPSSLRSIEERAFVDCTRLQELKFGPELERIESDAFCGCTKIRKVIYTSDSVDVAKDAFDLSVASKIEIVNDYAVDYDGMKLKSWGAFERLKQQNPLEIKRVDLSECVLKELPYCAFEGCSNLEEVILPRGLKSIEPSAFNGCHYLTRIELPEGLETVKCHFDECGIDELVLPRSLRSLVTSGLKFIDMSRCESVRIMDDVNFKISGAEIVYLPCNVEKLLDNCLYQIEYCFAPPTLKSIGAMQKMGFFCSSPSLELSRELLWSMIHVPQPNLERIQAMANRMGLGDNRFKVLEMPYELNFMYEK